MRVHDQKIGGDHFGTNLLTCKAMTLIAKVVQQ